MKLNDKKFLFITLNENLYNRQKYIIEILKEYINIDIFFLEDIFNKYSFFYIKGYYENGFWADSYSFNYYIFKKIFYENINPENYSGLILTYDWSASIRRVVQIFKEKNIPTFNILHEGFYIEINDWYNMNKYLPLKLLLKSNKNLNIPITDYSFVWWDVHKKEFLKRGYKGYIESVGTFKFEKYKKLKIDKKTTIKKLGINNYSDEKIFLYAFQILEENKIKYQYQIINDLMDYCQKNNTILILRNQLGYNLDITKLKKSSLLYIDGIKDYSITAEDSILLADKVFAINSTMLLEGVVNNKDSFSFKYFKFKSPFLNTKIINFIEKKEEISEKIKNCGKEDFIKNRKNQLKKMKLNGEILKIIKLLEKKSLNTKKEFKLNKKFFTLKYLYLFLNPFLIKNLIQSLLIYINHNRGKKS